jgi:hypothetical protein
VLAGRESPDPSAPVDPVAAAERDERQDGELARTTEGHEEGFRFGNRDSLKPHELRANSGWFHDGALRLGLKVVRLA